MAFPDVDTMNDTWVALNRTIPGCYEDVDETTKIVSRIQKGMTPIICALGLLGNIVATTVFLNASQRKTSCSLYLAARSISDSGFLLALLIVCMSDLGLNAFNIQGICQVVIFLTYICGFLSVWLVVMVTVENYVRICRPFSVNTYCNTKIAKIVIVSLIITALVVYNFPLWTTGIVVNISNGEKQCSRLKIFDTINQIVTYADTVLTLVVPTLVIVTLMVAITYSILELIHRQARLKRPRLNNNEQRRSSPQSKVTKLLFAVSFVFVFLTIPSHVIRLQMLIKYLYKDTQCSTMAELSAQKIFQLLYYLSFSVNIIIYVIFGDTFRKVLCSHLMCVKKFRRNSDYYDPAELSTCVRKTTVSCQYNHVHVQVPEPEISSESNAFLEKRYLGIP